MRLHRGGRFRGWLGRRFGGDGALGDRIWRRSLHGLGALVLVYFLLPPGAFGPVPAWAVLLAALAVVLLLEGLRWARAVELPTIRPIERARIASFAYFAVGLVVAVLVFPEAIAAAVVLGAALVDPLIGELRARPGRGPMTYPGLPLVAYALLAFAAFDLVGRYAVVPGAALAAGSAVLAVAVERVRLPPLDDDLTMILIPGVALTALVLAVPALPGALG